MSRSADEAHRPVRRRLWNPGADETAEWEIAHYLSEMTERLIAKGMTPAEARRAAEARFGDVSRYRARFRRGELRRRNRKMLMKLGKLVTAGAFQEVRTSQRHPAFAVAVVGTLALGIGANAAILCAPSISCRKLETRNLPPMSSSTWVLRTAT